MGDLYDALRALMPEPPEEEEEFDDDDISNEEDFATRPIRVAIVGRPNAGKSTLINHLLGEERLLTSAEAGTTRDSIAVEITWQGRDFRVFDTAGLRRRSRIEEKLEKLSVADALRAVRFAEVVVMMMDAQNRFEEQDLRIADLIEREGRALVIAVNKWDLMETAVRRRFPRCARDVDHLAAAGQGRARCRGVRPDGRGHRPADAGDRARPMRSGTSACRPRRSIAGSSRRLTPIRRRRCPGRRLKLNYITQAKARPPSFVLFCSRADAVPQSYSALSRQLAARGFDLPGTPMRITLREKANPFAHKRKRPS